MADNNSTPSTRLCKTCGNEYPATLEYFHKNKDRKDGLCTACKRCACEASRIWHKEHPEQSRARSRRYAQAYPEKKREASRRWREEHPEQVRVNNQRWREEHPESPEQIHVRSQHYYKTHPEQARLNSRIRKARKRAAGGAFTAADIELQVKAQTDSKGILHCWWCGKPIKSKYHIDHRIPITRNGSNDPRNLCLAHPKCNMSKGNKLPHEWNGRLL